MANTQHHNFENNDVIFSDQGVVTITLRGKLEHEALRRIIHTASTAYERYSAAEKKYIIIDCTHISTTDTDAKSRQALRNLLTLQRVDEFVFVGAADTLALIKYLAKTTSHSAKIQYSTSLEAAYIKIQKVSSTQRQRRHPISLITSIIIGILGSLFLIGWAASVPLLRTILPGAPPVNPTAAVALIATSYCFFSYWRRAVWHTRAMAFLGIGLSVSALLNTGADQLLFKDQLSIMGDYQGMSLSAAICFILLSFITLTEGTKKRWQWLMQYFFGIVITFFSLFMLFGQLYARTGLYELPHALILPFGLALALFISGVSIVVIVINRGSGNVLKNVSRAGWLIVSILVFVQIITYSAWLQTKNLATQQAQMAFNQQVNTLNDSVKDRVDAYINALHGFRGLFKASDFVSEMDFKEYYASLDLDQQYPGLRSMAFIAAVDNSELPAFIAAQQKDTPDFQVKSITNGNIHYIATYAAGRTATRNSSVIGLDLASIPGRTTLYSSAINSGETYTSTSVLFPANDQGVREKGFFITIPVRSSMSNKFIGVVNANFAYESFFKAVLEDKNLSNKLHIDIEDQQNEPLYHVDKTSKDTRTFSERRTISVATQQWTMTAQADKNYATNTNQERLPLVIVVSGQLFSILLIIIFILQSRARRRAFEIADAITLDLQAERNNAVAQSKKDEAILRGIGDGVFALNMKGIITLFNPTAEKVTGYSASEAIGKHYTEILHFQYEKTKKSYYSFIVNALKGKVTDIPRGVVLINKHGQSVPVADSAAPFYDSKHRQQGIIVVFRDATKERTFERTKDEFVSLASHQLRTPLSAINWYVELLQDASSGTLTNTQKEYLNQIETGNKRMVDLINSLLNVSRLDLGKLLNNPETVIVHEVIDSLIAELHGSIAEKQIRFKRQTDTSITTMQLDPKLFRMILQNLLSNAIKYTPAKGNVTLSAQFADKKGKQTIQGAYVLFAVSDTGYGIPASQQQNIFGKMYRAENVQKLGIEGTGLGLYIVKSAAEKMGGRVWFVSEEGKGTTFYALLPIHSPKSH